MRKNLTRTPSGVVTCESLSTCQKSYGPPNRISDLKWQPGHFVERPSQPDRRFDRVGPARANRFQHASRMAQVSTHRRQVGQRRISLRKGPVPVFHHIGDQPSRQLFRPLRYGRVINSRFKQLVCEPDRTRNPVRPTPVGSKAPLPVEVRGARLYCRANITKPHWPPRAVAQQVRAQNAKLVL